MSLESETAAYLRADAELATLLPGGIYESSALSDIGLTDPVTAPDVWADGTFQPSAVVRQRALTPTGDLQSLSSRRTSASQVVEVWVYARDGTAIEAALDRVYALLMGKRFPRAFSATWVGSGLGISQAPELTSGIRVGREDYRVSLIRVAAAI